jgi:transposase
MLTDEQWQLVQPLLPRPSPALHGRPPLDDRLILDAILWKFSTNTPWYDLPATFPPYQTCYRRYHLWKRLGIFPHILSTLYQDLRQRGGLDVVQALRQGRIGFELLPGGWKITAAPSLDGTWQLATALIFAVQILKQFKRTAR